MLALDLKVYISQLRTKQASGQRYVWGAIRKKWLVMQPEEVVRQVLLCYLMEEAGVPKNLISVEKSIEFNGLSWRYDVLLFDRDFSPLMLVECKAPGIKIDDLVFQQISSYNLPLKVPYLFVTNGLVSYCSSMNYKKNTYDFMSVFPSLYA